MANANLELGGQSEQPPVHLNHALQQLRNEVAWISRTDGSLLWIDAGAAAVFGPSAETLLNDHERFLAAVDELDRAFVQRCRSHAPSVNPKPYRYRFHDHPGGVRWLEEIVCSVTRPDGETLLHGLTRSVDQQQEVESALGDAEAVYDSLVESLPLSVLRKDVDGRIEYANPRACEEMGRDANELIGKTDFDLFPADLAKKYVADDQAVMQSGKLHHDVERHESPDGKQTHVEVWKTPAYGPQGRIVGTQIMFWDVSSQKNAEHQVEFEKFLLAKLLETVPDSVYFKDTDSRYIRISHSCARKFGLEDPRLAIGKSDSDFYALEHARRTAADERDVMKSGHPILAQIEHETYEDDDETWCSTTKVPLHDKTGKVIGTFGISRDVTEQKIAEQELSRERDLLQTIIDNVPDLIYVKDRAGRFVTANASLLRLLKLDSIDQLIGKTDYDFSPPEHACNYVTDDQNVMREGKPLVDREESHHAAADGTPMWLLTTKVPLSNESHEIVGVVGIGHDITRRKKADQQILDAKELADRANRAKSDFLANMSHEIRTPLNAIIGMTDLVLESKLEAVQRNYLSMVQESGESLLNVINDILDFSKIEAGKLDIDSQPFDLIESLGDTMKTLGIKAHAKGLELAFRARPSVPRLIVGDAGRIRQVMVNLVGNAIKFTENGEVVVEVGAVPGDGDAVVLDFRVRDTGIGIPNEKQEAIFNEFEQADSSTTRRFGGSGLGLAIASRLIRLMGGSIAVSSTPGVGSEFRFQIHLEPAPPQIQEHQNRGTVVLGGTRVLVVDDNETNRTILNDMLSNWGMIPTLASSAREAFERLVHSHRVSEPFGLVVSDVNMPQHSGYDLIERIRADADLSNLPVVLLTSGGREEDERLDEELMVSQKLIKPVKQSELFDAIVRTLGTPSGDSTDASVESAPASARSGLRILLAEDNTINQRLAVGVLSSDSHEVTVVSDGRQALQAHATDQFDLVLMDVQMPLLDGIDATKIIREREASSGEHLPIIAMTAHAMKGDREKCLAAGMDDYVPKPIRMTVLREKLKALIRSNGETNIVPTNQPPMDVEPPNSTDLPVDDSTEQEPNDNTPIDLQRAMVTVGGDRDLLKELISVYIGEATGLLNQLRNAVGQNDRSVVRRAAHTLKGASLSIGAIATSRIAQDLELTSESADDSELQQLYNDLESSTRGAIDFGTAILEAE